MIFGLVKVKLMVRLRFYVCGLLMLIVRMLKIWFGVSWVKNVGVGICLELFGFLLCSLVVLVRKKLC